MKVGQASIQLILAIVFYVGPLPDLGPNLKKMTNQTWPILNVFNIEDNVRYLKMDQVSDKYSDVIAYNGSATLAPPVRYCWPPKLPSILCVNLIYRSCLKRVVVPLPYVFRHTKCCIYGVGQS